MSAPQYSLDALIEWLERQPADGSYNFTDSNRCLIAQAFGLRGLFSSEIDRETFFGASDIANGSPGTFGAALSRALALQAQYPALSKAGATI